MKLSIAPNVQQSVVKAIVGAFESMTLTFSFASAYLDCSHFFIVIAYGTIVPYDLSPVTADVVMRILAKSPAKQ